MGSGELSDADYLDFLITATTRLAEFSVDGSLHYIAMDWRHMLELTVAGQNLTTIC